MNDTTYRPRCHPLTRQAVLDKLIAWIETLEPAELRAFWLYGSAGVGKSAILQTIAEWFYSRGLLLASFFSSRTVPTRNNRSRLNIIADPTIFHRSLDTQLRSLVVDPLLQAINYDGYFTLPPLIVIDGLDEPLPKPSPTHEPTATSPPPAPVCPPSSTSRTCALSNGKARTSDTLGLGLDVADGWAVGGAFADGSFRDERLSTNNTPTTQRCDNLILSLIDKQEHPYVDSAVLVDKEVKEVPLSFWASAVDLHEIYTRIQKMKTDMRCELVAVTWDKFNDIEQNIAQVIAHTRIDDLDSVYSVRIHPHQAHLVYALSPTE
ncbi:unnamed protein product [Cyclocybe aegerita]|uniref:Nephrocystin 3-like N-terminal domain-containing protein n=1 Tax=Cyclocybe aegerita TaxID=1973307 RepID=A0A8S0WCM7_CYCAE|nr:unnamed protein product [Cyclocybe aegerita]